MTRRVLPNKTLRARGLRREMTDAETVIWSVIRGGQMECKFRRQHPIGPFIVDFVCLRHRWALELDGSQHFESRYDTARTEWLEARGFRVMRFWNNEVLGNLDMVTDNIVNHAL